MDLQLLIADDKANYKYKCICGKKYSCRQNLHRHKLTCNYEPQASPEPALTQSTSLSLTNLDYNIITNLINQVNLLTKKIEKLEEIQKNNEHLPDKTAVPSISQHPSITNIITKNTRINNWKTQGIIADDWDKIFERYVNTNNCDTCNKFIQGRFKNLEHNHFITDRENIRAMHER